MLQVGNGWVFGTLTAEAFFYAYIRACQRVQGECGNHRNNKSDVLTKEAQYIPACTTGQNKVPDSSLIVL